jgi:hypothetical protein
MAIGFSVDQEKYMFFGGEEYILAHPKFKLEVPPGYSKDWGTYTPPTTYRAISCDRPKPTLEMINADIGKTLDGVRRAEARLGAIGDRSYRHISTSTRYHSQIFRQNAKIAEDYSRLGYTDFFYPEGDINELLYAFSPDGVMPVHIGYERLIKGEDCLPAGFGSVLDYVDYLDNRYYGLLDRLPVKVQIRWDEMPVNRKSMVEPEIEPYIFCGSFILLNAALLSEKNMHDILCAEFSGMISYQAFGSICADAIYIPNSSCFHLPTETPISIKVLPA